MRDEFDASGELSELRRLQAVKRRRRYARSKLDRWRAEIVALRRAGATLSELRVWLKRKRLDASRSTIQRFLKKLPEV
jgi:hypothetical protein